MFDWLFVWFGLRPYQLSAHKPVFHFNRIVAIRSVFYWVHTISSVWVFKKQSNMLRYATIPLKWKIGYRIPELVIVNIQLLFHLFSHTAFLRSSLYTCRRRCHHNYQHTPPSFYKDFLHTHELFWKKNEIPEPTESEVEFRALGRDYYYSTHDLR